MGKNKKYLLGMYEKSMPNRLSIKEKLLFVKEAGFDHLEISMDESDEKLARLDFSDEKIHEINQAILETNIPIRTMCLSGHRKYPLGSLNEETRQRSLDIMQKAISFATKAGIRMIQLAGYDVYYEQGNEHTRNQFVKNLSLACDMAAKEGILMGFETMETPFMDTVEKAMEYVNRINSPYLQVFPDIGNLTNAAKIYGHEVGDDLKKGIGHLIAAHLKETLPGHYREVPFGTGHTEYVKDLQVLKELGVHLFTAEFWYTGQDNWQEICKNASLFLRKQLDEVF
ncbi:MULTISPECIES: L-ribulose-5-phosphate 3-epimerase [Terrabacteria group]|uniref:L-ribulose-5-phosphate 3-epimerase n=1 Tax=Bacillati TaxID=1783272 RepID=UPI001C6F1CE2|nr:MULTISPECIES: L-ribulose-5-phosphate 3-epimerase [Terrabacteria group]MBW9213058.1 L-ribulose-5-phosphate 3-epimerase [Trueperella sp. zg.1013]